MWPRKLTLSLVLLGVVGADILYTRIFVVRPLMDMTLLGVQRLPASSLPEPDDMKQMLIRRGEMVWRISLKGSAAWVDQVRTRELNGYATVVRCDDRDHELFALGPYVGNVPIRHGGNGLLTLHPQASAALRYDIYVPDTGSYRSHADLNAKMPAYDLRRDSVPLCISIAGGGMQGAYGRSNEVRTGAGRTR